MIPHSTKTEELIKELKSNVSAGLTSEQAKKSLEEFGENKLKEKKKLTNFQRFVNQLKDVMIIILMIAAIISFVLACYEFAAHGETKEFFEPVLILLIVIINAIMGVMQESKAEKALEALKSMSAPHAKVLRDGKEQILEAHELVPGDIIRLEAGDFVPADSRLIKSSSLKSEESALTGESVPSEKDFAAEVTENAPIGDRTNMVFSSCSITYGHATALVTSTGMNTEMGKIAELLDNEEEGETPLQRKLAELGKYLGIVALVACAIIFAIGEFYQLGHMKMFMTAVSLAVSAIPEGLPAIVTIVLSIGVQRMVKKNAIIRRLPAVETLGSSSVICSDKTGTLTQNRMTLVKAYRDGIDKLEDITSNNSDKIKELLMLSSLCCDANVVFEGKEEKHIGDPTETAIVIAAHKNGMPKDELNSKYARICDIPFDSDRKLMSTVNKIDGKNVVIVKGAFDILSKKCIKGDIEAANKQNIEMSSHALRVLAVAYKEIDIVPENPTADELENGLIFIGLVGMIDPPRPEAKAAVEICKQAGIKVVMITGDHVLTAAAIAKQLGIIAEGDKSITGAELDEMSDEQLHNEVSHISVYARVSPENKIRIVKAWQKRDQVVSMTGDGVNDAPALKAADIGCAMGITGTDVAKGAADMTLTDDNFATIVDAVREGRGIYANIKKVVGFLLGTNIGEVLTVFFAMILWHRTPLLSMQLLWINLVTDSMPAIALGMEAVEKNIMEERPKPKNEGMFANGLGIQVFLQGCMFAILTLIGFKIGETYSLSEAVKSGIDLALNTPEVLKANEIAEVFGQTMAFTILAATQIVQAFNMRSNKSLFKIGIFSNKNLNFAALISLALIALVIFTPVRHAFEVATLPAHLYFIAFGLAFLPFFIMEIAKLFYRK